MTPKSQTKKPQPSRARLRILVAHGVNLDLLGTREPGLYGTLTLADIDKQLAAEAPHLAAAAGLEEVELTFFQSNAEAEFLEKLGEKWDGAVLNPGAWTHTSLALADRLKALSLPYAEVHLSNLAAREEFRQKSFAAPNAKGVVFGFGCASYAAGLLGLLHYIAASRR